MLQCYTSTQDALFLEGIPAPEFVKTASFIEADGAERLPDTGFALIVLEKDASTRMLPIHDKAHAWVSAQYVTKHWPGMPKTAAAMAARNICEAANFFDIEIPDTIKKVAALAPTTGQLYRKSPFDLPVGYAEYVGPAKTAAYNMEGAIYPITNVSELHVAEEWFDRDHTKLAFAHKYRMANFIVTQRANLLPPGEKTAMTQSAAATEVASYSTPNPQLSTEMYKRAARCVDQESFKGYIKLAHSPQALFLHGPAAAIDTIHTLDVGAGLANGYGSYIRDPIKTAMLYAPLDKNPANPEDYAAMADHPIQVDEVWGPPITTREISRSCDDGRVAKVMSQGFADILKKNPEAVLASLPPDLRKTVLQQIRPTI